MGTQVRGARVSHPDPSLPELRSNSKAISFRRVDSPRIGYADSGNDAIKTLCLLWPTLLFLVILSPHAALSRPYTVDYAQSNISFTGEHAGEAFEGTFTDWQADIWFDPAQLDQSHMHATIRTASATTGNRIYDGTLPEADWFAAERFPTAQFTSSRVTQTDEGNFQVEGTLTLRDQTHPARFTFPFDATAAEPVVTTHATLTLDRLAYHIGLKSDPDAEWVSREIGVTLKIMAK